MRYLIVGNGVAGITAAFTLRQRDNAADITVVSGERDFFFSRTALMYVFLDRMNPADLEPYERKVWDAQRIRLVRGWVRDLDAARHEAKLDGGETLRYDRLLLATGSVPNRPEWPGLAEAKEGVVNFVSWQDLEACERLTRGGRPAVVVGGGLIGVELVECLSHHGMEVDFLVREPWYWPVALGRDEGEMISEHIRRHGVRVRTGEEVSEVRSENGRVRGVKAKSGAEYQSDVLGIAIGVRPAIDWLRKVSTPPDLGRGIRVGPDFRTSLGDVWSAGDCAEIARGTAKPVVEQIWYSAKRQGELAAKSMLGDAIDYRPPLFFNSAKFFEIEYTTVGAVMNAPPESRSFYCRLPGRDVTVRVLEYAGAVAGFNMLGSRWNHSLFEQWIAERRSIDEVMEMLPRARFDPEFSRLDLGYVQTQFRAWRAATGALAGGGAA